MSKIATKAKDNVWYSARYKAAEKYQNAKLLSREGAAEESGIERTRLAKIELNTVQPYPEEALLLADTYHAPELRYLYCHDCCPLGTSMPEIDNESLDRLTIRTLDSMRKISMAKDILLDITADGVITPEEEPELEYIISLLDELNAINQNLKVWLEKNREE